jgi:hypothetical protein
MNTTPHRNPHGASHALRFTGLPALAHADRYSPELTRQARWSRTQPALAAAPRLKKSFWLSLLAGLLAFGALAFGVFVAASDTGCAARETGTSGNYSQSTLAPITSAGADTATSGSCKRKQGSGRLEHPKTML